MVKLWMETHSHGRSVVKKFELRESSWERLMNEKKRWYDEMLIIC